MNKYIIFELIPTSSQPSNGEIVQISALKVDGFQLLGRFDYRLDEDKIAVKDFVEMFSYDKEDFVYENETIKIVDKFTNFIEDLPLLILNNDYTKKYLHHFNINNEVVIINDLLNIDYNEDSVEGIMKKYNIQPSNHIVDLMFEALINESNKTLNR